MITPDARALFRWRLICFDAATVYAFIATRLMLYAAMPVTQRAHGMPCEGKDGSAHAALLLMLRAICCYAPIVYQRERLTLSRLHAGVDIFARRLRLAHLA